jgi:uncharacterized membrane protein YedE/YeeE
MKLIAAYAVGLIFGIGIAVSGMANPAKVVNFFDITGFWDPSLAFVMGAALIVTAIGYRIVFGRGAPILDHAFRLPSRTDLDMRLIGGAAVFGVGWGIAGFCPGGALPALGTGRADVALFVVSQVAGILLAKRLQKQGGSAVDAQV